MQHPQLLVSRVLRVKYPRLLHYTASITVSRPSWGSRSLLKEARVLSQGIAWKIDSGLRVSILDDNWVPGVEVKFKDTTLLANRPSLVSDLINFLSQLWDVTKVHCFLL